MAIAWRRHGDRLAGAWQTLGERFGRLFCAGANPNGRASWDIRGSESRGVCLAEGGLEKREKRWREVVKTSPHSLLSCFLAFSSSTAPLLPKARRRSKEANMKGIPEIVFSVPCLPALSFTDMEMMNPKYSLYLGCK